MAKLTGISIGTAICEALGIEPNRVAKVTLVCEVGRLARLEILAYAEESDGIPAILHSYDVVEREEVLVGTNPR